MVCFFEAVGWSGRDGMFQLKCRVLFFFGVQCSLLITASGGDQRGSILGRCRERVGLLRSASDMLLA